jgi:hypothetical protein
MVNDGTLEKRADSESKILQKFVEHLSRLYVPDLFLHLL